MGAVTENRDAAFGGICAKESDACGARNPAAPCFSSAPLREPAYFFSAASPLAHSAAELAVTCTASASPTLRTAAT